MDETVLDSFQQIFISEASTLVIAGTFTSPTVTVVTFVM